MTRLTISLSLIATFTFLSTGTLQADPQHNGAGTPPPAGGAMGGMHGDMPMGSKAMGSMMPGGPAAAEKHSGTLAEAQRCREQLLGGDVMLDEHQTEACVKLVSRFEGAGGGKVITIRMKTDAQGKNTYEPARVEIARGDTVKWVNESGVHNTAAYPNRIPRDATPWEAPLLAEPGASYARTFFFAGTYEFHCHPHEALGMKGAVIVERESRPNEFRKVRKGEEAHAHH